MVLMNLVILTSIPATDAVTLQPSPPYHHLCYYLQFWTLKFDIVECGVTTRQGEAIDDEQAHSHTAHRHTTRESGPPCRLVQHFGPM